MIRDNRENSLPLPEVETARVMPMQRHEMKCASMVGSEVRRQTPALIHILMNLDIARMFVA